MQDINNRVHSWYFSSLPETHDIITVFMKLHLETARILGTACKTVISLFFETYIGIPYLFHIHIG